MKLNEQPKKLWLEALEGTDYTQTREAFYRDTPALNDPDEEKGVGHCCLAVLTDVAWRNGLRTIRAVANGEPVAPGQHVEEYQELKTWDNQAFEWKPVAPEEAATVLDYPEWTWDGDPYESKDEQEHWHHWERCDDELPKAVSLWAGLDGDTNPVLKPAEYLDDCEIVGEVTAINANDHEGWSFKKIARNVREHL